MPVSIQQRRAKMGRIDCANIIQIADNFLPDRAW
jgi:hypothetical protein